MNYKTITIGTELGDYQEAQTYVVEDAVTAEQIIKGDDTGVICLCIQQEAAEKIASLLSAGSGA